MVEFVTVPGDLVKEQITLVLRAWGVSEAHSNITAEAMVTTDLAGIDSHGIGMLPIYHERRKTGIINVNPNIHIAVDLGAAARIDADRSLGHPASVMAMDLAIERARLYGVGVISVGNSNHFGAAGYYAMRATEQNMIGMAMTNAPGPAMVPTFGRDAVLGTNPLAFAAPACQDAPFGLDMATTTVAVGKLNIARRAGKSIPEGWALNQDGIPETDGATAFAARRLTPLGGDRVLGSHKGHGLGMMVEILCATLSNSWTSHLDEDGRPQRSTFDVGHFFMAIDQNRLRGDKGFGVDLDALHKLLRDTKPVDPDHKVMIPGDPERLAYAQRAHEGIPISATLMDEVRHVAQESAVPFVMTQKT